MARASKSLPPLHPGEVLREEFMKPYGLSAYRVAQECGVKRTRIERVVKEQIGISADTALRLGRLFSTTPQFWLNLQNRYEIEMAALDIGKELEEIEAHNPEELEAA
jgi:addiction module HigA family antidote